MDRLRDLNSFKERENAECDAQIKATDYDLYKLQERSTELSKIADIKEFDLRRTSDAYEAAKIDLLKARDELARLHEEQVSFSRALDLKMAEKADLVRRSENELARNRQLTATLYALEGKSRACDENLAVARREQDDLRFSNQSFQHRNDDLREEIDALQHHCSVLQNQNKDLNCELERFVQTDEQIRSTLNRRDRVESLRQKTEYEMHKSYAELQRSSPRRR